MREQKKKPRPRPRPYPLGVSLALFLLPACSGLGSFGRNVWENREEVFARLDALVPEAKAAGGQVAGFPVALVV